MHAHTLNSQHLAPQQNTIIPPTHTLPPSNNAPHTQKIRCLEFAPTFYSRLTDNCKERWTLQYEKDPNKWATDAEKLTVYADLSRPASVHKLPKELFDVIISTQAMEYPADTLLMAKAFHNMLQHGGLLMLTAPFIERVDSAYQDRYAPGGDTGGCVL